MSSRSPSPFEILPADYFTPLVLGDYFPRAAPLEVDVGCSEGAFLIAMAQRTPAHNFLGLERMPLRVARACGKAQRLAPENVRLLTVENAAALRYLLPLASVRTFHVAFPDPWPKRRHWPRRLVQPEFLASISAALEPGGELRVKTDDAAYFQHMQVVFAGQTALREVAWTPEPDYPLTTFEARFLALGQPIYRARLVKT